ncbi:MAG: TlyA family RNA methyltransferase [Acidimicrobiales bacterium]|nr:TlyA family RNA methyltransferase [Acidimicrobiales bacterium]
MTTAARRRLDVELHRRGLADSRQQAQALIGAGRVLVSGAVADKAARQVGPGEPVELVGPPPRFVGRGGEKLDAALDRFGIDVDGRCCLDAGSSTGGFTDALLQRGATSVVAVDVGTHQLHERLREDPRVEVREQTDIRAIDAAAVGGSVGLVSADLSFISVRSVANHLVALLEEGGDLVVLVKPQFEAGRNEASKGRGVIRDPEVWHRTLRDAVVAIEGAGTAIMDAMVSPVRGAEGNVEFLVHSRRTRSRSPLADASTVVDDVVAAAQRGLD